MLEKVKLALRITGNDFDTELQDLIAAAYLDLGIAGVDAYTNNLDPLIVRAVITYCRIHFGSPDEFDRLSASYWEQKAQLSMAFSMGYTSGPSGASGEGFCNG